MRKEIYAFGHPPLSFDQARQKFGTVAAVTQAVENPEPIRGFSLVNGSTPEWTFEAVVLRFPDHFAQRTVDCARIRLEREIDGPRS
jgi:hypothetical protein